MSAYPKEWNRRATIQPTAAEPASAVIEAARKLLKAKGRFHTEQNYKALEAAITLHDKAGASTAPVAPADAVRDARDLALERAAWMLDSYEKHLYDLTPINIEEHPYIPSISEAASELRALKSTPKEPA